MAHVTWNMRKKKDIESRSSALCSMLHAPCRRGFSLVEAIIYIGLLVLILVAVINMMLLMSRSYNFLKASRHMQISAITALDRMVREIRNAQSIDIGQSAFGTDVGVLTLNTTTVAGVSQTIQFYLDGAVRLKLDGVDIGPMTLPDVTVMGLTFRQITTGISQAVKIELSLLTGVLPSTRLSNFYGTAILRDSY